MEKIKKEIISMTNDPEILFLDGFDEALMGVARSGGDGFPVAAYDESIILEILQKRDEMTLEEARDFFEFNISGAYMGDYTPIFVSSLRGAE